MAKKPTTLNRNAIMLTIVFIIFCLPIILSVTRIGAEETRQFSIYNTSWDGTSVLKTNLENAGYNFVPIVSTLNSLTRLDNLGVLALIGPTIFIDPTETAALAYFIMRGGSVLIADDFGSANNIFSVINSIIAPLVGNFNFSGFGISGVPIQGFKLNGSLLMDYQSYYRSPVMPVIRNFITGGGLPSMSGVSEVITSYPSAISFLAYDEDTDSNRWVPAFSIEGIAIPSGIAFSTSHSWLEKDVEEAKKGEFYPDDDEWRGIQFSVLLPLPLGGAGLGNIILCSDPSIFINELMEMAAFDNAQLATNLFNWLDVNSSRTVFYDESHLSPAKGRAALSIFDPFTYVRTYLRYIDSFTMFPLLAPFFPLITLIFLISNFPRTKRPSPLLMTKIKQQKSRSFFAAKMTWYMNYQQYDKAIAVLLKRLKRRLNKKFGTDVDINSIGISNVLHENYPNKFNHIELETSLKEIEFLISKPLKITENEFLRYVLILRDIEGVITPPMAK
ncbi:MAG: DUF4350 domain-containing protein [Candidatus Thorarchaeota archaeon]